MSCSPFVGASALVWAHPQPAVPFGVSLLQQEAPPAPLVLFLFSNFWNTFSPNHDKLL